MQGTKLFISHAASDLPVVKAFVDLIEGGIGVPPRDIFCSSLKGQGIKPGTDFKSSIGKHLNAASCVVALLTQNFYASAFCMCELGGVWIQAKSFLPVLVPPLVFGDLNAVLVGLQASSLDKEADLDELRDEIAQRTGITPLSTPRWNERRDAFLKLLPSLLKKLPSTTTVPRDVHSKALQELADYKAEYKKREVEIAKLQAINTELGKLKDTQSVAAVVQQHSTSIQVFESLVDAAKEALRPLPSVVCEALYYRARNEDYHPKDREGWDEIQRPLENGQLEMNAEESGVTPCATDPKVRKAIKSLDELETWLRVPPTEFDEWYDSQFDGSKPDMDLRPFWDRHLR